MGRASIVSLVSLVLGGCGAAPPPPVPSSRPCPELEFRAPPVPPRRTAELVIAVNDEVCRREPLWPGRPPPRGRITEWCPEEVAPGGNRVEISVVEGGCGRPRARAVFACAGPEPD